MKKYLVLFTFFLLFFSEPLTAIPYWIKEGVYITYVSRPLEPPDPEDILNKHGYGTMTIVYNRSGQLFLITTYGNGQVNFTISSISSNLTKVKIKISGEYVVVRYYYPSNSTPNFTPFWNEDDVIAMESGPLMFSKGYSVMKVALWNLTLWGEYYIDTNTGDVYDLSGKYYGKTNPELPSPVNLLDQAKRLLGMAKIQFERGNYQKAYILSLQAKLLAEKVILLANISPKSPGIEIQVELRMLQIVTSRLEKLGYDVSEVKDLLNKAQEALKAGRKSSPPINYNP